MGVAMGVLIASVNATLAQPASILLGSGLEDLSDSIHVEAENLLDVAWKLSVVVVASKIGLEGVDLISGGVCKEGDVRSSMAAGGPVDTSARRQERHQFTADIGGRQQGIDLSISRVSDTG